MQWIFFSSSVKSTVRRWQTLCCLWVWWNSCQFVFIPKPEVIILSQQASEASNIVSNTRDSVYRRVDSNSPLGGLPSSGHWAKWSNRFVSFATVGNFEKFWEAETIYVDWTFKVSPAQLFIRSSQHIQHTVNHIPTSSSYRQHYTIFFILYQFPLRQLPTSSIPTLSTPTLSTLTKWEFDKVGIDEVGRYHVDHLMAVQSDFSDCEAASHIYPCNAYTCACTHIKTKYQIIWL